MWIDIQVVLHISYEIDVLPVAILVRDPKFITLPVFDRIDIEGSSVVSLNYFAIVVTPFVSELGFIIGIYYCIKIN